MPGRPKKILLFEDDYESMYTLKDYLETDLGYEVTLTAEKGLLERLGRERFDLILVDSMIHSTCQNKAGEEVENVRFEGVSWHKTGLEVLRRLRQGEFSQGHGTPADVPAIVLSAVADNALEGDAARELSVARYVEKPYRLNELVDLIRTLIQEL